MNSRFYFLLTILLPAGHFIQGNKSSTSNTILLEEFYTFLSYIYRIYHDIVKWSTGGGNGHIILLINCSQITL